MISGVLIAMTAGLLFGSFVTANRWIEQPTSKHNNMAYNFARARAEMLWREVRQDSWDSGELAANHVEVGPKTPATDFRDDTLNGVDYWRWYRVNNDADEADSTQLRIDQNGDGQEDYRRVEVTVLWQA